MFYDSRKLWSVIFGFVFVILSSAIPALACSCRPEKSTCLAYGESKAAFVGKVTEGNSPERMSEMLTDRMKTGSNERTFKFTVSRAFAGAVAGDSLMIHTGFGFGDCGFPFQAGEEYIVYAYEDSTGQLATNICTRTRLLKPEDVREVESLFTNRGAQISGKLTKYQRSSLVGIPNVAIPGFGVQLTHEESGRTYKTRTDLQGVYSYRSLPGGKYQLAIQPDAGWIVEDEAKSEITVNPDGCAERHVNLVNDSVVAGRVVRLDGEPVQNVWVELIPVGISVKNSVVPSGFTVTESDGRFVSSHVPPGKYTVSINYLNAPDDQQPFPTVFAPSASNRDDARVIEIRPGTKIDDVAIQIPSRLEKQTITGVVLWPDGKPVKKNSVGLSDILAGDVCVNGCVETDDRGRFTLSGYPGRDYSIWARGDKEFPKLVVSYRFDTPPFKITAATKTFRIRLKKWRVERPGF